MTLVMVVDDDQDLAEMLSIVLNGAVAHLGKTGDRLTIMTFVHLTPDQIKSHTPKVIVLNDDNEIINRRGI